jgi:hypothetical protein
MILCLGRLAQGRNSPIGYYYYTKVGTHSRIKGTMSPEMHASWAHMYRQGLNKAKRSDLNF